MQYRHSISGPRLLYPRPFSLLLSTCLFIFIIFYHARVLRSLRSCMGPIMSQLSTEHLNRNTDSAPFSVYFHNTSEKLNKHFEHWVDLSSVDTLDLYPAEESPGWCRHLVRPVWHERKRLGLSVGSLLVDDCHHGVLLCPDYHLTVLLPEEVDLDDPGEELLYPGTTYGRVSFMPE